MSALNESVIAPSRPPKAAMPLQDKFGRQITDLRISITDRCNFRCVYCRSADPENHMASIFIAAVGGIRPARAHPGGNGHSQNPRHRRRAAGARRRRRFYRAAPRTRRARSFTSLQTAHLLADRCDRLVAAGLNRINISLDSLDQARFEKITHTKSFHNVIAGIDAAQASSLRPVKVNAVLVRGINDDEVEAFAEFARDRDLTMRFIEYMPLDADRHWTRDLVVTAAEIHRRISARWPLVPIAHERSETARKYRFADGRGEIGLIAPVSQPFCGALLAHSLDRRRKTAHLFFQQGRSRFESLAARRRQRRGNCTKRFGRSSTKKKKVIELTSRISSLLRAPWCRSADSADINNPLNIRRRVVVVQFVRHTEQPFFCAAKDPWGEWRELLRSL